MRVGIIPYLNARPLTWGLDGRSDLEIVKDIPSALAGRLLAGEVEAAFVPVVECLRAGLSILPGFGVCSEGPVGSVLLFLGKPLDEIRRVALDGSSRSSAALCRVLLAGWGRKCEFVEMPPSLPPLPNHVDAALLIGDPALREAARQRIAPEPLPCRDLGEAWTRETGLPFVYAVWAARSGYDWSRLGPILLKSARQGLRHLPDIARTEAQRLDLPEDVCLEYVSDRIRYRMAERQVAGLREFGRRCRALGLVGKQWEPNLWQG